MSCPRCCCSIPSIVKKFLMALSGLVLALFVLGHMIGNLQMFEGPEAINRYANFLQTLPWELLWGFRLSLLGAVVVHVWMAILLAIENRRARPEEYRVQSTIQATLASRTMAYSGSVLLFFIVFHLAHFTLQTVFPEFRSFMTTLEDGREVHDVYRMVIIGFSHPWVSVFYIISMALLCLHLSHGVSSLFQSLGLRNRRWRWILDRVALLYAWTVFLGFIANPVAVLLCRYAGLKIFPVAQLLAIGAGC